MKKRGRPNTTGIELTYEPEAGVEGWVARWQDGESEITAWSSTRKGAHSKAYRFMTEHK